MPLIVTAILFAGHLVRVGETRLDRIQAAREGLFDRDAGFLEDGSDTSLGEDTELRRRVAQRLGQRPGDEWLRGLSVPLSFQLAKPNDVYVVSNNYGLEGDRGCGNDQHTAKSGLNNLASTLDSTALRCFDTAPFRDTHDYADSLYKQMFDARGAFFMGCPRPMVEDSRGCE
ncbi:MAG: hypothetical protein ACT4TC_13995 [Myxococcaceae bacterium]